MTPARKELLRLLSNGAKLYTDPVGNIRFEGIDRVFRSSTIEYLEESGYAAWNGTYVITEKGRHFINNEKTKNI